MIQDPTRRYALLAVAIIAAVALLWLSTTLQAVLLDALELSNAFIDHYPVESRLAFVALAAFSAMMLLFSSVALVPVAVSAWGQGETLLLLTAGWFVGANTAYIIGRGWGRCAAEHFVSAQTLDGYQHLLSVKSSVTEVTILKLALPSEVPSFLLGILRYPVGKLVVVLLASELPFALWAVYLSAAFLDDRRAAFLLVLLTGLAVAAVIARHALRRR